MPDSRPAVPPRPDLEHSVDIGNEAEIDRIVKACIRPVLSAPELREELMPPGRRAWFEGFIARCAEGAILQENRAYLNRLWKSFEGALVLYGVIPTITEIHQLALDPDAKDDRRGWAMDGHLKYTMFLQDRVDIRELLESAFYVREVAAWCRYPGWYGRRIESASRSAAGSAAELVASYRVDIARYVPLFGPQDGLLRAMLDDEVRKVRHIAAIRLATLDPDAKDEQLLDLLLDAAADPSWTWSFGDHYNNGRKGCHEAFLALERFGPRAHSAAPRLKAEIAALRGERWWEEWLAKADRLVDLFEGRREARR